MTATLSTARSFNPGSYYEAGRELELQARLLAEAVDDVRKARETAGEGWQGESASAFSGRSNEIEFLGGQLSCELNEHAHIIAWYADKKNAACKRAVGHVDQLVAFGFDVSETWKISLSVQQLSDPKNSLLAVKMVVLQAALNAEVEAIGQVDLQAAALLADKNQVATLLSKQHQTSNGYTVGAAPDRDIVFDDDFPFRSKAGEETWEDYVSWAKWEAILRGAQTFRPDLDDALPMYAHFRDGSGTPVNFDLEEGYQEDDGIRRQLNSELSETVMAANELVNDGYTSTEFHSEVKWSKPEYYPTTENWQKTLGDHAYYSDSQLSVVGDTVTLTTTITAKDRWNFNDGMSDIKTGASDSENGRFEELGWGQSFDTTGSVTRTYTWKVGEQPPNIDIDSSEGPDDTRDGGRRSGNEARGGREDRGVDGGARYPRAEPGKDDKVNRYPDGREY